ncbi:putative helicase MOV-10 isoform X2 [Agrilus planipennis]|uniref:RNA helicase n=1 Tax=Agrilus planipennis TaxID=224129 RepID=A0A7F5QVI7_AGRPL|nr:putative helicase MOV-10 isoform X2 [Agrilus planipennis]
MGRVSPCVITTNNNFINVDSFCDIHMSSDCLQFLLEPKIMMNKRIEIQSKAFINYLYECGLIDEDLHVKRKIALEYMKKYKALNKITKLSMGSVLYYLKNANYIYRDYKVTIVFIKENVRNLFAEGLNESVANRGEKNKSLASFIGHSNSGLNKEDEKGNKINKKSFLIPKTNPSDLCDIAEKKKDNQSFNYILQEAYAVKKFDLVNEAEGIIENMTIRNICSNEINVFFHFINYTTTSTKLIDVVNPFRNIVVEISKPTDLLFGRQTTITGRIILHKKITVDEFVVIFVYRNEQKKIIQVVKKLDVCNNYVRLQDAFLPEGEFMEEVSRNKIVSGTSRRIKTSFRNVIAIKDYLMPNDIRILLTKNLRKHPNLTLMQEFELKRITKMLNVHDPQNCLTVNNYCDLLRLLLYMEEHKIKSDLSRYNLQGQKLVRTSGLPPFCLELRVVGLAESRPSPVPGDSVFVKEENVNTLVKYEGIIHNVKADSVVLGFDKSFANKVYSPSATYTVYFSVNRRTLRCEHQAIELIQQHKVQKFFFPDSWYKSQLLKDMLSISLFHVSIGNLNPKQQQAVQHIVSKTSFPAPYLVFGPPGTGKTMTMVEAIFQVYHSDSKCKILICAPSNSAVDELTKRLVRRGISNCELFRWISSSYSIEAVPVDIIKFSNIDCKLGQYFHPSIKEILKFRIVATTIVSAAKLYNGGTPTGHFTHVFIDESGHAKESETLIPIAGILTSPGTLHGQIVLAGDPQQLGPIIHSDQAITYGFGTSMLERFMKTVSLYQRDANGQHNPNMFTMLLQNYRSHPYILHTPNKLFYGNELIPCGYSESYVGEEWQFLKNKKIPVLFHGVIGQDKKENNSPSYFNMDEVAVVMSYIDKLIKFGLRNCHINAEQIGIISPYTKQVEKIRNACRAKNLENITVGSVEKFQGQERLVILLSTVRSQQQNCDNDQKFKLGFLRNPKRFNVALTRAKALLIVIGNPFLLENDENWREFLKFCIENHCLVGAPFNLRCKVKVENVLQKLADITVN